MAEGRSHSPGVRPPGVAAAVAASFPSMESARVAIEALEHAGVDGDDIELLGRTADAARTPTNPKPTDRRVALHLVRRIAVGAALGALAGFVLGVLAGLIVAAVTDATDSRAGLVTAFAIVGIGIGTTLGILLAFERAVGLSDAWPLTFEDVPDGPPVWVAVYTRAPRERARAADALSRLRPLELRRGAA
jgi:MFS family permease